MESLVNILNCSKIWINSSIMGLGSFRHLTRGVSLHGFLSIWEELILKIMSSTLRKEIIFQEIYNICTQTVVLNGCRINIKRYMCVCKLSKWYFTKQGVMVTGQVIWVYDPHLLYCISLLLRRRGEREHGGRKAKQNFFKFIEYYSLNERYNTNIKTA